MAANAIAHRYMVSAGLAAGVAILFASQPSTGKSAAPEQSPVIVTDLGAVRGVAMDAGGAFRGIPYASAPVGPLRWREAQPAWPWQEVRDATHFGPICPQPVEAETRELPQSEDCLTLNVVTPNLKGRKLPVLVAIHGGAFFVGSGRYIADKGLSPMVRRGVVLVSPNYRIGRLGFFTHPALTAEAGHGTGNFWLSDQIAALDWVKRNIARFGGDPDNITILGCSAGGSSVNSLVASPMSRGLFAKASVHSGGGFFNATRTLAQAEQQGKEFAARAGITGTGPDTLTRLRALSPEQVLAADPGPPNFGAIVDGRFLPARISEIFAHGKQAYVPLISGSTSNEASIFGLMGFNRQVLARRFDIDMDRLRPVYDQDGTLSDAELLRQVQTDFIFTSASMGMTGLTARTAPAWSYYFDYVPQNRRDAEPGAPHCADMPYIFGTLEQPDADSKRMSRQMQDYWYNFIAHGNPNGIGLSHWPRTRPGRISPLVIRSETKAITGFRAPQMALWFAKWKAETGLAANP